MSSYNGPERRVMDAIRRREIEELEQLRDQVAAIVENQKRMIRRATADLSAPDPPSRQCSNCVHLFEEAVEIPNEDPDRLEPLSAHACRAFPGGIPAAIAEERHDHRRPLGGETDGLTFEPRNQRALRVVGEIDFGAAS